MKQLKWYAAFLIQVLLTGLVMAVIERVMGWQAHLTLTDAALAVVIARIGMMQTEAGDERP